MTSLTNEQAFAELYYSKRIIKDVLGITVQCWRPAYGDVDDRIRYIAQALGMVNMLWTEDTNDWEHAEIGVPAVDALYQSIVDAGSNGTWNNAGPVVLSHEVSMMVMRTNWN
jgi:peptidoglycan/xylan/chitin deacetylase (PgdA/CDA1 family)